MSFGISALEMGGSWPRDTLLGVGLTAARRSRFPPPLASPKHSLVISTFLNPTLRMERDLLAAAPSFLSFSYQREIESAARRGSQFFAVQLQVVGDALRHFGLVAVL
jgi:hypothetical protein